MKNNDGKYPKGHFVRKWMILGIAIFGGLGVPLSVVADNKGFIGLGPAIGLAFGVIIGSIIERKYKDKGLLTENKEDDSKVKKLLLSALIAIGIILLAFIIAQIY
ncbi:MAG: hypothetical protein C0594_15835 [Marinilabiliales bacterium]|nr:MAG: hypothetical protein C0594_15835 [Marinilabiliales bacterium]